jgi:hypothetical protein
MRTAANEKGAYGYLADLRNVAGLAADHVLEFGSADFVSRWRG